MLAENIFDAPTLFAADNGRRLPAVTRKSLGDSIRNGKRVLLEFAFPRKQRKTSFAWPGPDNRIRWT